MAVTLVISDLHAPYSHPDVVPFLAAVKRRYRPTTVVLSGDETDKHAMSFHDHDPDLPSPGDEHSLAVAALQPLYAMFPKALVCESNHGSLAYRRAMRHGLSKKYLRSYRDVMEAPKGWSWHLDIKLTDGGNTIFFTHGMNADVLRVAQKLGVCVVQGHFHSHFAIEYSASPMGTVWGMTVGCLVDQTALAFAYGKSNMSKPVLGCGVIIDGWPRLLPMLLTANGRWTGDLV